jgi:3-isopropylmalate dehydratase
MPAAEGRPQTLYDKVFQDHIVDERLDGTILLYIGKRHLRYYRIMNNSNISLDRHLVHEVTSPVRRSFTLPQPPLANKDNSKLSKA